MAYEQMDEVEVAVFECVQEHHIQHVAAYLAELCRSATRDNVSDGKPEKFWKAAEAMESAAGLLSGSGYHHFRMIHNA